MTTRRVQIIGFVLSALVGGGVYQYNQTPSTPIQPLVSAPSSVSAVSSFPSTTTLRAVDGKHFVSAWPDGEVVADKPWEQTWETFTVEKHHDRIAFKSFHGKYCAAEDDQTTVNCNRDAVGEWELWMPVRADGGWAFRSTWNKYLVAENGGGGEVRANRDALGPWETFTISGGSDPGPGPGPIPSTSKPLKISDGRRWFKTDDGLFDWREVSAFSLQSRMQRGEDSQVRALLKEYRALGFTVTRVMLTLGGDYWEGRAGSPLNYSLRSCPDDGRFWTNLDKLLNMHVEEGMRTRLVIFGALECFGGVWDPQARRDIYQGEVKRKAEDFAIQLVTRLRDQNRTHVQLELANEPAAIGMRDSSRALRDLGRRVKAIWPQVILNLGDSNGMAFADLFDGAFDAVDRHVDRNNGLRFIEADKRMGEDGYRDDQPRAIPAISGEPKNMGELRLDGRNGDVATHAISAYSYAAVTRSRQILPNFHYDGGLWTTPIKPETVVAMKAYHRALNAFPMIDGGNRFRGHWSEAQGNWFQRDPYPATDDIRDIERHIQAGRGPWRVFGLNDYAVVFPYKPGLDPLKWTTKPASIKDRYADDLYEVAILNRK